MSQQANKEAYIICALEATVAAEVEDSRIAEVEDSRKRRLGTLSRMQ